MMDFNGPEPNMGIENALLHVQRCLAYQFKDRSLLQQALVAARADEKNPDGNRRLGQLGEHAILLALNDFTFSNNAARGNTSCYIQDHSSRDHRAKVAQELHLDVCIQICPRQLGQPPSKRTLSSTLAALIGALWWDCGKNFADLVTALRGIGILTPWNNQRDQVAAGCQPRSAQEAHVREKSVASTSVVPGNLGDAPDPVTESGFFEEAMDFGELGNTNPFVEQWDDGAEVNRESANMASLPSIGNISQAAKPAPPSPPRSRLESPASIDTAALFHQFVASPRDPVLEVPGDQIPAGHNKSLKVVPCKRKGTEGRHRPESRQTIEDIQSRGLRAFIEREQARCQAAGVPFNNPFNDDGPLKCTEWTRGHAHAIRTLYFTVGSAEALFTLRKALSAVRSEFYMLDRSTSAISIVDRFRIIQNIGDSVAHHVLAKRCHTYQLFKDAFGPKSALDPFVIERPQRTTNRSGNPQNCEKSNITDLMIDQLCPNASGEERARQRRLVNELRRLGERLAFMVDKIGLGILCLIPTSEVDTTDGTLALRDDMITAIPDGEFRQVVGFLQKQFGQMLSDMSSAVEPIVLDLLSGNIPRSRYLLEDGGAAMILEQPREASHLLQLLSETI